MHGLFFDLAVHDFLSKTSQMQNEKSLESEVKIPWAWIAVTIYCTALAFAFVAQWLGVKTTEDFLYRYQTFLVGLATIVVVFLTLRQLRMERRRDALNVIRHYEPEIDALGALRAELEAASSRGISRVAAALLKRRSGMVTTTVQVERWARLRANTNVSLSAAIDGYLVSVEALNAGIQAIDAREGPLTEAEDTELHYLRVWVDDCMSALEQACITRQQVIMEILNISYP